MAGTTRGYGFALLRGLAVLGCLCSALLAHAAGGTGAASGFAPTYSSKAYDHYLTGNATDVSPPAPGTPMLVLMGGGLDVDEAFQAMIAKAGSGQPIDIVVIRASGADGYNDYLYQMGGADSVETLVIKTRQGAEDATVNRIVAGADMLFIAGGDQWNYINLWRGTALDRTLQELSRRQVPIGGTSAGLAVLGQFDFSAQNGTITSTQAMADPYHRRLTLDRSFITDLPGLANTITDAHLVTRDRMGRLMTFLARLIKDGWVASAGAARGIGVDEQTAVIVDAGVGSVVGIGAAYFLQPTIAATTIKARVPLTFRSVRVDRLYSGQGPFDLAQWSRADNLPPYWLSVETGVLTASGNDGPY